MDNSVSSVANLLVLLLAPVSKLLALRYSAYILIQLAFFLVNLGHLPSHVSSSTVYTVFLQS